MPWATQACPASLSTSMVRSAVSCTALAVADGLGGGDHGGQPDLAPDRDGGREADLVESVVDAQGDAR